VSPSICSQSRELWGVRVPLDGRARATRTRRAPLRDSSRRVRGAFPSRSFPFSSGNGVLQWSRVVLLREFYVSRGLSRSRLRQRACGRALSILCDPDAVYVRDARCVQHRRARTPRRAPAERASRSCPTSRTDWRARGALRRTRRAPVVGEHPFFAKYPAPASLQIICPRRSWRYSRPSRSSRSGCARGVILHGPRDAALPTVGLYAPKLRLALEQAGLLERPLSTGRRTSWTRIHAGRPEHRPQPRLLTPQSRDCQCRGRGRPYAIMHLVELS
jgi:hypothetical protein